MEKKTPIIYTLRKILASDLQNIYLFVCDLEKTQFNFKDFETIFLQNIVQPHYYYLVAEAEQKLLGYISCHVQLLLHHCGKVGEIQELYVDEDYRGMGIGTALLNYLEKELSKDEVLTLEVTAQLKREQTHQFYALNDFSYSHKKFIKQI